MSPLNSAVVSQRAAKRIRLYYTASFRIDPAISNHQSKKNGEQPKIRGAKTRGRSDHAPSFRKEAGTKNPPSSKDGGYWRVGRTGFEPVAFTLKG